MKRKIFSILFTLVLVLSFSLIPAMPAAAVTFETTTTLTVPDNVYRPAEFVASSTTTNPEGGTEYTNVRFNITLSGPDAFPEGTYRDSIFTITKVNGSSETQGINETFVLVDGDFVGYWGPEDGFPLSAPYEAASTFTVQMTDVSTAPEGNYELTVELVDLTPDPDVILATATDSFSLSTDALYVGAGQQFTTIQDAIDNASAGDTINVASGTYNESVTINKNNLTIEGDFGSRPSITGGLKFDTDLTGLMFKNFVVSGNAVTGKNSVVRMYGAITDTTIDNCVFDGENIADRHGFTGGQIEGDLTVTNSEFKNILGWAVLDTRSGSGGDGSAMGTVTFANNDVHHCNGSVVFRGLSTDWTDNVYIYGNTFQNIGEAGVSDHWAAFEVNRANNVEIYGNQIRNVVECSWGEGQAIQLWKIGTADIYANTIENNYMGIYILKWPAAETYDISNISIHNNFFSGNEQYALSVEDGLTGAPLNAEKNWWGDATGPTHASNPHGSATGDAVSDNVDFMPWYATATTTPTTQNVSVEHPSSSIIAYSDTIQGGIDAALAGDTINVAAGTYVESVTVGKALSLLGPNVGINPNTGTRVAEAVIETANPASGASAVSIEAANVTLDGFTLYGPNAGGSTVAAIWLTSSGSRENVYIQNNRVFRIEGGSNWNGDGMRIYPSPTEAASIYIEDNYIEIGMDMESDPDKGKNCIAIADGGYWDNNGASWVVGSPDRIVVKGNVLKLHSKMLIQGAIGLLVEGNTFDGYWGPIELQDFKDVVITGNQMVNQWDAGIYAWTRKAYGTSVSSDLLITNNTITETRLNDTPDHFDDGTAIILAGVTNATVANNTITGGAGSGIVIGGMGYTHFQLDWEYFAQADPVNNVVHYNNISSNTLYGIENKTTVSVDAAMNWWGDASGPNGAQGFTPETYTGLLPGTGDAVSANVWCLPWLTRPFEEVAEDAIAYFGISTYAQKGWNIVSTPLALDQNVTVTVDTTTYKANTWGGLLNLGEKAEGDDYPLKLHYTVSGDTRVFTPIYYYDSDPASLNPGWRQATELTQVNPVDAYYLRMKEADSIPILFSPDFSVPSKELYHGWNLVGYAYMPPGGPGRGEDVSTSLEVALKTIERVSSAAGDVKGYAQVVSPSMNQMPWVYIPPAVAGGEGTFIGPGGEGEGMMVMGRGYWVFMENPGTLAGLTFTPMSFRMD